ncbi:hypothetical protein M1329_01450 [Candidatus Marsarchaeota archaeon]|nr:hypothetical protein [Candidatus Marsarchaeota archaeon]MCL5100225.1 hypothetical protein [Candidatus Marsarchaeota archaeon]
MDRTDKQPQMSEYQKDLLDTASLDTASIENQYIEEHGNKFRVPYRIVRQAVFSKVKQAELIDLEHAARLQYRLMLNDAILKARVHYARGTITVIYNPQSAQNLREKIGLEGLVALLAGEGVHVDAANTVDSEYDYYKNFYSYAFNPPAVREHPPYGYTIEEWRKMKPDWERKTAKGNKSKQDKFTEFQEKYIAQHPELAKELGAQIAVQQGAKKSILRRIFSQKA